MIPVVWGIDRKYILQAFVVMYSILKNSEEEYYFFILTADNIEKEAEKFADILKKKYSNFKVSVISVDTDCFARTQVFNLHLSQATYFRLLIPKLLPDYKKCIYLDCDIIVFGNLKDLYDIALEDNYIAGVRDCHINAVTPRGKEHQKLLGIPSLDNYINAGVLLMNLEKIRQDRLLSLFLRQIEKINWYEDQDVINICCYPYIKILPLKYNLFHFYFGKNIKFLYRFPYEKRDFDFEYDNPFILHMGGAYKPWLNYAFTGSREWWNLAEIFESSPEYQYYRQRCENENRKNTMLDIIDKAKGRKCIAVWGYSTYGKYLCDFLLKYQLDAFIVIVDNNESVWGKRHRGIYVCGFEAVTEKYDDIFWIISCRKAYGDVKAQLKAAGVADEDMMHYINQFDDSMYLLALQKDSYDSEIDKIADMEYVRQIPPLDERRKYIKDIIKSPLLYLEEYAYLEEKYHFDFWIQTLEE